MSVALPILLFGVFALLEQQMVEPFAGQTWVYVALLAAWGVLELRPARRWRVLVGGACNLLVARRSHARGRSPPTQHRD